MQRILKYSGIQNIIVTPDKQLNILIGLYRMRSYVIIAYKSYALQKMVRFLAHPVQSLFSKIVSLLSYMLFI